MTQDEEQFGFQLGDEPASTTYAPNLTHIREDLGSILEEARTGSDVPPWDLRTLRYKKIVFLQMAKLLPEDEGEQLCFEFAKQVERIEALLAA